MMRITAAALALALSGVARAQEADAPVPAHGSDPQAWFDQYIDAEGWTVLGADGVAIALGSPEGVAQYPDGKIRATVRHEYYQQRELGGHPMRSMVQVRDVDCQRGMNRVVSITLYERSNLQGASWSRQNENAGWTTPEPESLYLVALDRICAAPTEGERLN